MGRGGAAGGLASSDAMDGSLRGDSRTACWIRWVHSHYPVSPRHPGWTQPCAGWAAQRVWETPTPALPQGHIPPVLLYVLGLLSVWFELDAGLCEPRLISGFIAQPGACKMVTFYCFLAFSFLFLSLFSLPYCFKFPPQATKMQGLPLFLWGHIQVIGTPGGHAPHFSPAAHPVPQVTDPRIPPPG